jgi:hypothetical protein
MFASDYAADSVNVNVSIVSVTPVMLELGLIFRSAPEVLTVPSTLIAVVEEPADSAAERQNLYHPGVPSATATPDHVPDLARTPAAERPKVRPFTLATPLAISVFDVVIVVEVHATTRVLGLVPVPGIAEMVITAPVADAEYSGTERVVLILAATSVAVWFKDPL